MSITTFEGFEEKKQAILKEWLAGAQKEEIKEAYGDFGLSIISIENLSLRERERFELEKEFGVLKSKLELLELAENC